MPVNNAIIPLLHALLKEQSGKHGKALLSDVTLLRNLLADYAPQYRAERNLLLRAVEENIPTEIIAQSKNGDTIDPLLIGRWVKRLESNHGIASENARWAVRGWIKALGRKVTEHSASPSPIPQVKASPPAPKIEVVRPTGFSLPLLEWCDIPEGYVTIEGQRILVPAFKMAKYPVTYAQFQAFIDAPDGYRNDDWWQGLAQRDKVAGDQKWKIDKHPRETVNWYESIAFSRWLGAKTGLSINPADRVAVAACSAGG